VPIITLLTDFGERDGYVGAMKGVILGIAPHVSLVDISHDIPPQDIPSAAYVLWSTYRFFPPDTIHLVVVDPGVGTERRPIAVQTRHGRFVAPDNGVLGYVLEQEEEWQAVHLTERRFWRPEISQTFHGRDIFAPTAAHLAAGVPLHEFGPAITDPVAVPFPQVRRLDEARCQACLVYIDRFGNCVTNLPAEYPLAGRPAASWGPALSAQLGDHLIRGLHPTYAAVAPGTSLLLVGSSGFVEIAVREGNAAARFGARAGDLVEFRITPSSEHHF
jgi:S-adenosylmethionine hydrolase